MSAISFVESIKQNLETEGDKWNETGSAVGKLINTKEELLVKAYSLDSGDTEDTDYQNSLSELRGGLGLDSNATIDSIRLVAKTQYERAVEVYNLLIQTLSNVHQTAMRVIQQITVR